MALGRWGLAIICGVFLVSLPGALFFMVLAVTDNNDDKVAQLGGLLLVYYASYGFLSLLGWLAIGMPVHWLVCKYGEGKNAWYVLAIVLFTLAACGLAGVGFGGVLGTVALLQWSVFRFFVYRP